MDKYRLPPKVLKTPMLVSSLGAKYMASTGCFQMPLTIGRHVLPLDLIILESHVILAWIGYLCMEEISIMLASHTTKKIHFRDDTCLSQ